MAHGKDAELRFSVIGLGKLGAPLAAVMASKGFPVIGVDLNADFVQALNDGRAPVEEPRLQELIDANRARLSATTDVTSAIHGSDVTFIIVPTPSNSDGWFSNRHLLAALADVGDALRSKSGYHLVVITSTVMPGSTDGELRAVLEHHSGRTVGAELGLCYNPEFIALGSVVRNMLAPDFILIGESDPKAGELLAGIYKKSCDNDPQIKRMNFVNAELTKISVNSYVTTKISYANMLAGLCERLPCADVDVVTDAIGADSRIGRKYLQGAIGYGGPCFPRDNVAFAALARKMGARADLAEATQALNQHQIDRIAGIIDRHVGTGRRVAVLGLSYKPDTGVVEESQGLMLADHLARNRCEVLVYDPQAMPAAIDALGTRVVASVSADACVGEADVVVIATAWPQFRTLSVDALRRPVGQTVTVIDLWRILPAERYAGVADIIYPGVGA